MYHPGSPNMSSRTPKYVIPDPQTCHPGLDPGSPRQGSYHFPIVFTLLFHNAHTDHTYLIDYHTHPHNASHQPLL